MQFTKRFLSVLVSAGMIAAILAGCGSGVSPSSAAETNAGSQAGESGKLVLYASITADILESFIPYYEEHTGVTVELVEAGTGELIKRIESEGDTPLGDVLIGGTADGNYVPKRELFESYLSPNEEFMFPEYKNRTGHVTSTELVTSVLMVNTDKIAGIRMEGYADLLNPELKGRIAHSDPTKASSAFEHMMNQLYAMGNGDPDQGWDYMRQFVQALDGKILSTSGAVFRGVADGEYPVGLSYEAIAYSYKQNGAPVDIVYMKEGVISQPGGVAIIKNAPNLENAKKFVDLFTSKEYQTIMTQAPLYRRSSRSDVPSPEGLVPFEKITLLQDDPDYVNDNKQAVLDKFKDLLVNS